MRSTLSVKVAAATRFFGLVALVAAPAAASPVVSPAAVLAYPAAHREIGMYGDPAAAAPYWREQHASDCGEMAVADVVGQITGREPTEQQVTALAENTRSTAGPGSIWKPHGTTDIRDLPVLLRHYGISSDNIQTNIHALTQRLGENRKVIVILSAETIWSRPGKPKSANHFVVVTGIDSRSGVVHLNDSAIKAGRDEQVPIATFEQAWAPNYNSAIVTR
jgi:Peptidase_C39 like family